MSTLNKLLLRHPNALFHAAPHRRALLWLLAASIVTLGLLDQGSDYSGRLDARVAFGILLCLYVGVRFLGQLHRSSPTAQIHGLVRRLSREVYLLMYVLVAIKLCRLLLVQTLSLQSLPDAVQRSGVAAPAAIPNCMEGFQGYLASGLVALIALRLLARLRLTQRQRRGELTRPVPLL